MKQARAFALWLSSWNAAAWIAAGLCAASFAIMIFGNHAVADTSTHMPPVTLWDMILVLLLLPIGIVILLPVVAAPQFVIFWLVRRTHRIFPQSLLLFVSAAMLIPYYRFVATADLISTSTASLEAAFYPLYLAVFAVPLSLAIFGFSKFFERSRQVTR